MLRLVLALLLLILVCSDSRAEIYRCPKIPFVNIASDVATDNEFVCATAATAFTFLDRFGLFSPQPLSIQMLDQPIASSVGSVYGSYDPYKHQILLMHFDAITTLPDLFTLFSDDFGHDDYAGIIAHELTHAMVQQLLHIKPSAMAHEFVVAQEYLAYAIQIAVMSEERKRQLVVELQVEAWQSGHVISAIYLAFAPHKFAVKSYLHLVGMADPQPFLSYLLHTSGIEIYVP